MTRGLLLALLLACAYGCVYVVTAANLRGSFAEVAPDEDSGAVPPTTVSPTFILGYLDGTGGVGGAGDAGNPTTLPPLGPGLGGHSFGDDSVGGSGGTGGAPPPTDVSPRERAVELVSSFPAYLQVLFKLLGRDVFELFASSQPLSRAQVLAVLDEFTDVEIQALLNLHAAHPEVFQIISAPKHLPLAPNLNFATLKVLFSSLSDEQQLAIVASLGDEFAAMLADNKIDDQEIDQLFNSLNDDDVAAIKDFIAKHPGLLPGFDPSTSLRSRRRAHTMAPSKPTSDSQPAYTPQELRDLFFGLPEWKQSELLASYGQKLQEMLADGQITEDEARSILSMFTPEDLAYLKELAEKYGGGAQPLSFRAVKTRNPTVAPPPKDLAGTKYNPQWIRDNYFKLPEEKQVEFLAKYGAGLQAMLQDGSISEAEAHEIISMFSNEDLAYLKRLVLTHPEAFPPSLRAKSRGFPGFPQIDATVISAMTQIHRLTEVQLVALLNYLGGDFKHFVTDGAVTALELNHLINGLGDRATLEKVIQWFRTALQVFVF